MKPENGFRRAKSKMVHVCKPISFFKARTAFFMYVCRTVVFRNENGIFDVYVRSTKQSFFKTRTAFFMCATQSLFKTRTAFFMCAKKIVFKTKTAFFMYTKQSLCETKTAFHVYKTIVFRNENAILTIWGYKKPLSFTKKSANKCYTSVLACFSSPSLFSPAVRGSFCVYVIFCASACAWRAALNATLVRALRLRSFFFCLERPYHILCTFTPCTHKLSCTEYIVVYTREISKNIFPS